MTKAYNDYPMNKLVSQHESSKCLVCLMYLALYPINKLMEEKLQKLSALDIKRRSFSYLIRLFVKNITKRTFNKEDSPCIRGRYYSVITAGVARAGGIS